ncbi:MAG: sigma-70 family RNA polymerase sigma factor [Chloroflexota bacterium]
MEIQLAQLVEQAKAGNQEAIVHLTNQYEMAAKRAAYSILGNQEDAEDAVQDAWVLGLQRLQTLRDPARFGAWFYQIVANVARRKRQQRAASPVDIDLLERMLSIKESPTQSVCYLDLLPMALNTLSDKDHLVTTLHYLSGVSIPTIAALFEIPQGTIKSRLHHARQVMRKEILKMANQTQQPITNPTQQSTVHVPIDFRDIISGMQGKIGWQKIFTGSFEGWSADHKPLAPDATPDFWQRIGQDGLVGEEYDYGTQLTYGEASWRDIEFSAIMTPLAGGNAQMLFRVDEAANRFYAFDLLMGWQAAVIRRIEPDAEGNLNPIKLSVVHYPFEHGQDYPVTIMACEHSITSYINGALVNQVTDGSWMHGQVGLTIWESKTLYRDIRVRLLN